MTEELGIIASAVPANNVKGWAYAWEGSVYYVLWNSHGYEGPLFPSEIQRA